MSEDGIELFKQYTARAKVIPKHLIFGAADITGVSALVSRTSWRNARLAILCYHGISLHDEHEALPMLYMQPALFRSRLERLRSGGYNVLSLAEGLNRLFSGDLPPRSVVLTFDDGTRDFAEIAVPLLCEFGMPATVYLTTYYCEHRIPVFDTSLRYLLWRGRASGADVADIAGVPSKLLLDTPERRAAAWTAIYNSAKQREFSAEDKHSLLELVAARVGVEFADFVASGICSLMTPDQVATLPRAIVDVQLHTHRHRTPRDMKFFSREIIENRLSLSRMTGGTPTSHFCYPSGDYWGEFLGWLRGLGVTSATTCVPSLASRTDNPLLLPRFVDTSTTSHLVFDAWVNGTADLLPHKTQYRLDYARLDT